MDFMFYLYLKQLGMQSLQDLLLIILYFIAYTIKWLLVPKSKLQLYNVCKRKSDHNINSSSRLDTTLKQQNAQIKVG